MALKVLTHYTLHIKMLGELRSDLVVHVLAQVPSFTRVPHLHFAAYLPHLHFAAYLSHENNVRTARRPAWGNTHTGSSYDVSGTSAAPSPAVVEGIIGVAPKKISVSCNVPAHDDVTIGQ